MTIKLFILSSPLTAYRKFIYPPGSKCKALRLGVYLILLYFIRILFWVRNYFFILWVWVWMWVCVADFFVFKFLDRNIVYSLCIDLYLYEGIIAQQKYYGFLKYLKLEIRIFFFKIKAGRMVFNFSCKTSDFELVFSLFD